MALSLREIAYAIAAVALLGTAAHMTDRIAFGIEMASRGLASHQFEGNR